MGGKVDRKELKILKNILIKEKERIMKSISQLEENTQRTSRGSASTGPGVPTHIAELGTDTFEKDLDINLTSSEVVLLQMIEESLKKSKIENMEYVSPVINPSPRQGYVQYPMQNIVLNVRSNKKERADKIDYFLFCIFVCFCS